MKRPRGCTGLCVWFHYLALATWHELRHRWASYIHSAAAVAARRHRELDDSAFSLVGHASRGPDSLPDKLVEVGLPNDSCNNRNTAICSRSTVDRAQVSLLDSLLSVSAVKGQHISLLSNSHISCHSCQPRSDIMCRPAVSVCPRRSII